MTASRHGWVRRWLAASGICVIGFMAATASAQPEKGERVPVAYLVDRTEFKAIEYGDLLTFELHQDPACSEALDSDTVIAGSDPDLLAEAVSSREIGGVRLSAARLIRLRYVMEPTSVSRRLYLRVTGAHVTPIESECQAQAASVQELSVLYCASVASSLTGAASPFTATAACPQGTVRTGGGHFGVSPGDTVLSSQADGSNGWFCSVAGAVASGSCQATCCALE